MRRVTRRIAMWSGPRNISTAMMRAWENRADCTVWDEPLYGYYLHKTGIAHPGADEVIADQGTDWASIVKQCSTESPGGKPVFYQNKKCLKILYSSHLLLALRLSFLSNQTLSEKSTSTFPAFFDYKGNYHT